VTERGTACIFERPHRLIDVTQTTAPAMSRIVRNGPDQRIIAARHVSRIAGMRAVMRCC